jgi:cell division protein FtsN
MNKKNNRKPHYVRRARTQQKTSPFAWLAIGMLIGLIIPSIFLIKSHYNKNDSVNIARVINEPIQVPSNKVPLKIVQTKNASAKPQYEFYNLLSSQEEDPNKKTEAKATEGPSQFSLQIANYNNYLDADQLKAKLLLVGIDNISITKKKVAKQITYEVVVGPFRSRSEADKVLQHIKESAALSP